MGVGFWDFGIGKTVAETSAVLEKVQGLIQELKNQLKGDAPKHSDSRRVSTPTSTPKRGHPSIPLQSPGQPAHLTLELVHFSRLQTPNPPTGPSAAGAEEEDPEPANDPGNAKGRETTN